MLHKSIKVGAGGPEHGLHHHRRDLDEENHSSETCHRRPLEAASDRLWGDAGKFREMQGKTGLA